MPAEKFKKWKQKVLLGVSLTIVAPTGQSDPAKLVLSYPQARKKFPKRTRRPAILYYLGS